MIDPHQYVYLVDNRGEQRILKVAKFKKCRWRKLNFDLTQVLAFPFYTVFNVDQQGNLTKEPNPDVFYFPKDLENESEDEDKDNRELFDHNTSQKLTQEDITQLKSTEQGEDIVKKLVSNSETFTQKTQYSQIKYLSKKKSKYIFNFTVEPISLHRIQRFWYNDSPGKINYMRIDSLGLFLQLSGLLQGSKVLFFENTFGLALAGVLQRVAPSGTIKVILAGMNKSQLRDQLPLAQMNFTDEMKLVTHLKADQIDPNDRFTHLLISGEFKYTEILENALLQLELGGTIVIYSSFLEAITEAAEYLHNLGNFSHPFILDSFFREQQVLPNRTHPMVEMNAFGGYLLQVHKLE